MIRRSGVFEKRRLKKFYSSNDAGLVDLNYWGTGADGNVTIAADTTWESSSSGEMMVRNLASLTVNSGVSLTIKARKGCIIYVSGDCVINGTIWVQSGYQCDPVSAGVPSTGLVLVRKKTGSVESGSSDLTGCGNDAINSESKQPSLSGNGKRYVIARAGASGGAGQSIGGGNSNGYNGTNGSGIQSGGGGGGGVSSTASSGSGVAGTCFAGGPGGGGGMYYGSGGSASANGGAGGNGSATGGYTAGGGAGNPGGAGGNGGNAGTSITGGTLILLVKGNLFLGNGAYLKANGGAGGVGNCAGGGGSGGGIIVALYAGVLSNNGTIQSLGGAGGSCSANGGSGGNGSVTIEQILR